MCGIAGIAYADRQRTVELDTLRCMATAIAHRGPDDEGFHVDGNVGLAHRRLSIVDLAGGHQPMSNEDQTVWISYNGEIYNHAELRARLEPAGHVYATRSDTETIVHAYEEYGAPHFPSHLRGMFAFAVWDSRRRTLVLARDRVGIKPLYYHVTKDGDLYFASEIAALLASGTISPDVDATCVQEYFAQGHVSGDRTLLRGVRVLRPGTVLLWRDGEIAHVPFAQPPGPLEPLGIDLNEAAAELWHRLVQSVELRLMSDVPVGVFLSGGLDSSLLIAAVRELEHPALATFSVGYEHAEADEVPWAARVAESYGCPHHVVRIDERSFFDPLPSLTRKLGQPLTFSASSPLFAVSTLARDHGVKVVLAGEGADELFAGYARYPKGLANLRAARVLDRLPRPLRQALRSGLLAREGGQLTQQLQRTFLARRGTLADAYLDSFAIFREEQRTRLLRVGAADSAYQTFVRSVDPALLDGDPLNAMLRLDQATYLQELLAKQDHMSMAASIETRVPFLDHELVAWARRLPAAVKLDGRNGKLLAKKCARGRLPDQIIDASKRGFLVPMTRWFRRGGPAFEMLADRMPAADDDVLDRVYVERLLDQHGKVDHGVRLWTVLAFQLWRESLVA